jgi:hypothetical protein
MRSAMRRRAMVYRRLSERKAEQARAGLQREWMTLVEAIELIKRVDTKSGIMVEQLPYEQICDAIEEGELRARWLDKSYPPRGGSGMLWTPDDPSYFVPALRKRKLRFDNGGEIHWGDRRWRMLLLSREDMRRIFDSIAASDSAPTKELQRLWKNEQGVQTIHEAILAVYNLAEEQGVKPPNVREIRGLVQRWLAKYRNATAPRLWIEERAADPRYHSRRGKPGVTLKGRLRPASELEI